MVTCYWYITHNLKSLQLMIKDKMKFVHQSTLYNIVQSNQSKILYRIILVFIHKMFIIVIKY